MAEQSAVEAGFVLDSRLTADTIPVTDLTLCKVLLINDSRYPWLILVPKRAEKSEIHHLAEEEQATLLTEITQISEMLEAEFRPDKINIGALGNIVSQLHVHIIARNDGDAAWPGPVWGHSPATAYTAEDGEKLAQSITQKLT
ncbi:MAG: HIT family protein [Rhodospirillaceae bacterium]|jgi:diadenosine tetraphosphate (Ap4A) HIT family hydrolase|nr:HIT family protein [Rhodospirillaceae bacterium]